MDGPAPAASRREDVYWMDSARVAGGSPCASAAPPSSTFFDVAVIGGGCAGLSTAYWLRQHWAAGARAPGVPAPRVVVVEARGVGEGASGRNGGHIYPDDAPGGGVVRRYGRAAAGDVHEFVHDTASRLQSIARAVEERCEGASSRVRCRRGGAMMLYKFEEEVEAAAAAMAGVDASPDAARLLTTAGVTAAGFPGAAAFGIKGATWNPAAASWNPYAFIHEWLLPNAACDVARARVDAMAYHGNEDVWVLTLDAAPRRLCARAVVLATNGYTQHLCPSLPITPVRGQCIATDIALPCTNVAWDDGDVYVAATEDGCVVGGMRWRSRGCEVGVVADDELHEEVSAGLRDAAGALQELVGGEEGAGPYQYQVTHEWTGVMGFTPDLLPLVGEVRGGGGGPRLYCCGGFSGEGMAKAFGAARVVSGLVHAALWDGVRVEELVPEPWLASVLRVFDPNRTFPEDGEEVGGSGTG